MTNDVRYCRTEDDVQIAYSASGAGPPLVICPFFFEAFSNDYRTAVWYDFLDVLTKGRQVIRFDFRGTGLSQREGAKISLAGFDSDLEAVVRAAGLRKFDLLGWVISSYAAIAFAAHHPEQIAHLALYAAAARAEDVMPRPVLNGLAVLCRTNWQMASQNITDMSTRVAAPELGLTLAESMREAASGNVIASIFEDTSDYTPLLPQISSPTMVLHRVNDSAIPFAAAQRLASLIPDARLAPLHGDINYPPLGDWQAIVAAINGFLTPAAPVDVAENPAVASGFRTILFTDLVGHTQMMHRLGDDKGRDVLREHETVTRAVLKQHGGAEVKTMGDGFMASFPSVTKGVECAIALQKAFAARNESTEEPLHVRVGLNAGEPIEEDGDLFGETVIMTARIAAMAKGGEILSSLGVRELCGGKGFLFADRGEFVAKGFEDPVRVYEVSWRG